MTNDQIISIVEKELQAKTLGVTEQYLEIHSPVYINDKLKVDRIDQERSDGIIVVYLPVALEKFYFIISIEKETQRVVGFNTEPFHRIYFRVTSETFTGEQLKSMTKLAVTESWSKGDPRKGGRGEYLFSAIKFLPNPEPGSFAEKLFKLLAFLEKDRDGIKQLVARANCSIQSVMDIHNGNGMLGGETIEKESIKRMSDLGLEIDFDLYVGGNKFKEHH